MTNPAAVARYMQKAQRALDEARLLLGAQKAEGACNRAYYAMHDAAQARLRPSSQIYSVAWNKRFRLIAQAAFSMRIST